jgi:CubicO group peptidase (beta-lactamase class C family)
MTSHDARTAALGCTFLLALLLVSCGSDSASTPNSGGDTLPATIDNVIRTEMQRRSLPAVAIGLAKNGVVIYLQSYGVSNLGSGEPAAPATVFELASLTKQFTAALVLQLHEEGRLGLDDSLASRLPQYGFSPAITIRMLLNQTSGLPDYLNLPEFQQWYVSGVPEPTVLNAISHMALQFEPGSAWQYSNSNYFLLGAVIESVTNQSYAETLAQRIFAPLALGSTYYALPPAPPAALGYTLGGGGAVSLVRMADRSALFAAGALSADVADVLKWDQALYSGTAVSAASFKEMTTAAPVSVQATPYGFGLALDRYRGRPRAYHTGYINGFLSYNELFLDDGFALVVLMNADFDDQQALGDSVYDAICGSPQFAATC